MLSPDSSLDSSSHSTDDQSGQVSEQGQSNRRRVPLPTITQFGLPTPSSSSLSNNPESNTEHDSDINRQTAQTPSYPVIVLQPVSSFRHKRSASNSEPEPNGEGPASSTTLTPGRVLSRKRSRFTDDGLFSPPPNTPATALALTLGASLQINNGAPTASAPAQLPTPLASPEKPPFDLWQSLFSNIDLIKQVAIRLPIEDFLSLYAIKKQFYWIINSHFLSFIKEYVAYNASETATIFTYAQYVKTMFYDPAVRPSSRNPNRNRTIPSLRWLQKIMHCEDTVDKIIALLACEGIYLPRGTSLVMKKIWFLLEHPTTGSRVAIVRDAKMWTDKELLLANMFIIKLDLRFGDPWRGQGEAALTTLMLTQKSLVPLLRLLEGHYTHSYSGFVNHIVESFYIEVEHAGQRDEFGDWDEEFDEDAMEQAALVIGEEEMEEYELAQQGLEYAPQTVEEYLAADGDRPLQPLGTNPQPQAIIPFMGQLGTVLGQPQHTQAHAVPNQLQIQAPGMQFPDQHDPDQQALILYQEQEIPDVGTDDDEDVDFDPNARVNNDLDDGADLNLATFNDNDFSDEDLDYHPDAIIHNEPEAGALIPQPAPAEAPVVVYTPPDSNDLFGLNYTAYASLRGEHWDRYQRPLLSPDVLIMNESASRGLNLHEHLDDMLLWGFRDPRTGDPIPAVRKEWLDGEDDVKYEEVEHAEERSDWEDYFEVMQVRGDTEDGDDEEWDTADPLESQAMVWPGWGTGPGWEEPQSYGPY